MKIGALSGLLGGAGGTGISASFLQKFLGSQGTTFKPSSLVTDKVSFNELKVQLQRVGTKLANLKEFDHSNLLSLQGDSSQQTDPNAPTTRSLKITAVDSGKGKSFSNQISKALNDGYSNGNDTLLKNGKTSGELSFSIGDGADNLKFSLAVDGQTTAQNLVDQFNSQAQGKATASLVNQGTDQNPNYKIAFDTTIKSDNSQSTSGGTPNVVLGGESSSLRETQATLISSDLKAFADSFNKLVKISKKAESNLSSDFQDDLDVLDKIQSVLKSAKSSDGTVSFSSFMKSKSDGTVEFDAGKFTQAYVENPDAVEETVRGVSQTISGGGGLVQDYANYGGKIDKLQSAVVADMLKKYEALQQSAKEAQSTNDLQGQGKKFDELVSKLSSGSSFLQDLSSTTAETIIKSI